MDEGKEGTGHLRDVHHKRRFRHKNANRVREGVADIPAGLRGQPLTIDILALEPSQRLYAGTPTPFYARLPPSENRVI